MRAFQTAFVKRKPHGDKMLRILFALGFILVTTAAYAIQIAPECKKMKDPIGCTCAVQNGGGVEPQRGGGMRWFSKRSSKQPTNEAFVKCNMRARGLH
jgi:hypothetical protein